MLEVIYKGSFSKKVSFELILEGWSRIRQNNKGITSKHIQEVIF